ncbi:MAG: dTDP-4-keto-6-deoxy-D-glucose epimerase [Acidobacteria bacterium]|nr:dTDP-4-keto-6-deoxy-D-glucose epimerase [Acidobacteriota bacterium]
MVSELVVAEFATEETAIAGLLVINARSVTDDRGTVRELYRGSVYSSEVSDVTQGWRQINLTRTRRGAVRGLHGEAMAKLVTVACGSAFGVYVDTRPKSSTSGNVVTVDLIPGKQVFVPRGVCNGFQATSEHDTEYLYFFDAEWRPTMAGVAVTPLDRALGVTWPIPIDPSDRDQISEKDAAAPTLSATLRRQVL